MIYIIAATTNAAKISAIQAAFEEFFGAKNCRVEGVAVDSSVANQPSSNKETRTGARQRVMAARQVRPEADYWVGIESGIEDNMTFAWIVIENSLQRGESRSASLSLPSTIVKGINEGNELSEEMAKLTALNNLHQEGGAIGYFSHNRLTRSSVYHQALILALVPLENEIYQVIA